MTQQITISHSPDSDDAFMFYALTQGKIPSDGVEIVHDLRDIETLNRFAMEGKTQVSALSLHAFAYVSETYALLDSGGSIGYHYGPVLVSNRPLELDDVKGKRVAVPGRYTSAALFLRLWCPDIACVYVPFDQVFEAIASGQVDAGIIIHEGQLTYAQEGFVKILDLGEWWFDNTGLPLPLGGNVIRRDLGMALMKKIARLQRQSIQYALDHRQEALDFAMGYARGLARQDANRFVGMYVNERTVAYGDDDRKAIALMLQMAYDAGIIPQLPKLEFITDE